MPLFEVETDSHIIITWASDSDEASGVVTEAYPHDTVLRLTKRPRDTWVISKSALGITGKLDPCNAARDCLSKPARATAVPSAINEPRTQTQLEWPRRRHHAIVGPLAIGVVVSLHGYQQSPAPGRVSQTAQAV